MRGRLLSSARPRRARSSQNGILLFACLPAPRTHSPTHPRTHACALAPLSRRAPDAARWPCFLSGLTQDLIRARWVSDAHAAIRWSAVAAGSREAERLRWDNNAHNLTDGYALRAERKRSKQLAVIHMPEFLKVRAPPPGEMAEEWLPPQPPPAVANPVQGRSFGKVVKLENVKGKRWIVGGYYNRNYHGKGVYIGRLQQDRLGNVVEFL